MGFPMNKTNILFICILLALIFVPPLATNWIVSNSHESTVLFFRSDSADEANNLMRIGAEHELKQHFSQAAHSYMDAGNYFEKAQMPNAAAFAFRASGLLFQRQADEQKAQLAFIKAMEIHGLSPNNRKALDIRKMMKDLPDLTFKAQGSPLKLTEIDEDLEWIQAHLLVALERYPLGL
jgi:hypothetical protein